MIIGFLLTRYLSRLAVKLRDLRFRPYAFQATHFSLQSFRDGPDCDYEDVCPEFFVLCSLVEGSRLISPKTRIPVSPGSRLLF